MNKIICFIIGCSLLAATYAQAADTPTNQPSGQLAIELRDGSRVMAKALDDSLSFRSSALGEMELPWSSIRSVECADDGTAKLSATNGDVLTIQLTADTLPIQAAFGKTELPVKTIRSIKVLISNPGQASSGLVALWSGEGNANDSVSGNNGTLTDVSFANGKIGQAFSFNGDDSSIMIPANSSLNIGAGDGFTLTAWIKPSNLNQGFQIIGWNNGGENENQLGVEFCVTLDSGPGSLYANIVDTSAGWHQIRSRATMVSYDFQFVALTYDKTSGIAKIYCNGKAVAVQNMGSFTPQTSFNLYLGNCPNSNDAAFSGLMDEVSIYNRALSDSEIQALCTQQNGGQLPPPPDFTPPRIHFNQDTPSGQGASLKPEENGLTYLAKSPSNMP
ncbi:MAG TPA: LamG domain-containing protein [Verrucomicrobiae bacterium]|nr:LamG domain-containing protein [Verrucomicrobiae bacterium]